MAQHCDELIFRLHGQKLKGKFALINDPDWTGEVKLDGYKIILFKNGYKIILFKKGDDIKLYPGSSLTYSKYYAAVIQEKHC